MILKEHLMQGKMQMVEHVKYYNLLIILIFKIN